ncbi:MAG TPA: mannose-1-phosphate guanylyltransferase [Trueperaceae bacterium]
MNDFVAVIMAGGRGQRFWPLSTEARPKQFLDLGQDGRTLIQATFDRVLPLAGDPSRILVATGERYVPLVCEQLPELPAGNLIVEPVGRDSGPAVALASLEVQRRFGDVIAGFFSADHRIVDANGFQRSLASAIELAAGRAGLVTVGITPTQPSTGYGYIEQGAAVGAGFEVSRFVEKPNLERATHYLESGNYLWNAGMFVWPVDVILEELDAHAPELMAPLRAAFERNTVARDFPELPKISIDYAVMEHTRRAYVVRGEFDWDDIGDWVALERLLERGEDGSNTVVGQHVGHEAYGNIVYTESSDDVIVTLGVEDLVIVKRGNTVLLVRKDRVQELKKLLEDERLAELVLE